MSLLNLPGLSLGTGIGPSVSAGKQDVTLDPGSEWRFEIPFKSKYTIKVCYPVLYFTILYIPFIS